MNKRIIAHWVDPWTGEFLAGFDAPLLKELLAASFYSRQIKALKNTAQSWCGVRKPKLRITYNQVKP